LNAASAASLRLRCFDLARTDCLGFTFTEQDKGFRMTQKPRPLSVALWSAGSSGPDSAASSFFCRYIHGNRYIHIMTRSSLPRVLGLRRHRPCQAQYWVQVCRLGTGVSTSTSTDSARISHHPSKPVALLGTCVRSHLVDVLSHAETRVDVGFVVDRICYPTGRALLVAEHVVEAGSSGVAALESSCCSMLVETVIYGSSGAMAGSCVVDRGGEGFAVSLGVEGLVLQPKLIF
jgi:hypothetical protein